MTDRRPDDRSVIARIRRMSWENSTLPDTAMTDDRFSYIPALTYVRIRARVTRARIARECSEIRHPSSVIGWCRR